MDTKELLLRMDSGAIALLEQEIKNKRNSGVATSVGDKFLIRFLGALADNSKALSFKIEKNKIVVKSHTLVYDDNRHTRTQSGEADRANPQP